MLIATGSIQIDCAVSGDLSVDRVEWLYPEMREAIELEYRQENGRVYFDIPTLIVCGIGVLYLHAANRDKSTRPHIQQIENPQSNSDATLFIASRT